MIRDPQVDQNDEDITASEDHTGPESQSNGAPPAKQEQTETGSMEEELEEERQRAAEYLDQAQRARAELVNYRRRTEEELARMQKQAGERIIAKLLPALDDLDRAVEQMGDDERSSSWGEGITLVQRKIWSTLESEGVAPIDAVGQPFDPSLHEAISIQEGSGGATTVVQQLQRGYMLGDRVIRPSMVVVGDAADAPEAESRQDESEQQERSGDEHD